MIITHFLFLEGLQTPSFQVTPYRHERRKADLCAIQVATIIIIIIIIIITGICAQKNYLKKRI